MSYIYVEEYIGGLGNQLFQYFNLIQLSKIYNKIPIILNQDISFGYINSKVYNNIFNLPIIDRSLIENTNIYTIYSTTQFELLMYNTYIDLNEHNICIKGLSMNINNFKNILYETKLLLNMSDSNSDSNADNNNCIISFRSFNEENRPDWRISNSYYIKAIKYIQNIYPNIQFAIFSDNYDYAHTILNNIDSNINCTYYIGSRDGTTDVEHFYKLCNYNNACV
jgi:hypothetical protein